MKGLVGMCDFQSEKSQQPWKHKIKWVTQGVGGRVAEWEDKDSVFICPDTEDRLKHDGIEC